MWGLKKKEDMVFREMVVVSVIFSMPILKSTVIYDGLQIAKQNIYTIFLFRISLLCIIKHQ